MAGTTRAQETWTRLRICNNNSNNNIRRWFVALLIVLCRLPSLPLPQPSSTPHRRRHYIIITILSGMCLCRSLSVYCISNRVHCTAFLLPHQNDEYHNTTTLRTLCYNIYFIWLNLINILHIFVSDLWTSVNYIDGVWVPHVKLITLN